MASYQMLQLTFTMDETNGPVQVTHNYGTGSKLDASMTHALGKLCNDGRIEEVIWDKDYWVLPEGKGWQDIPGLRPGPGEIT